MSDFIRDGVAHGEVDELSWLSTFSFEAEAAELERQWLRPFLANTSRFKGQRRICVGQPHVRAQLYVALSVEPRLPGPAGWPCATSGVLARVEEALVTGDMVRNEAVLSVERRYVAKLFTLLLDSCRAAWPLEESLEVGLEHLLLGRINRDGFVPTPRPVAIDHALEHSERERAFLKARDFPGPMPAPLALDRMTRVERALRHDDGRLWKVVADAAGLQLEFHDSDGDVVRRSRAATEPFWEAEALVRDQLRDGFVEVT